MIMPCMKLMSAIDAARGAGAMLAGDKVLLSFPGAPGCTIGAAFCCANAATLSKSRTAEECACLDFRKSINM